MTKMHHFAAPFAVVLVALPGQMGLAFAPECSIGNSCVTAVTAGGNTEGVAQPPAAPIPGAGFLISIDGKAVTGDATLADRQRQADVALSDEDIDLRFDGLGVRPRLDAEVLGTGPYFAGDRVTFRSRMNYPAFVTSGEIRIYDLDTPSGTHLLMRLPIEPNGEATVTLPKGDMLVFVYRVRDRQNRFDETAPVLLGKAQRREDESGAFEEAGRDSALRRHIPVRGGAVTVFARSLPPGSQLQALGATVTPDAEGKAVVQRILPPGTRAVPVRVSNSRGPALDISRDITIPRAEWFAVGVADLTYGRRTGDLEEGVSPGYSRGRLSFYAKGKTASGHDITAHADTREDELDKLFTNLLEKDPRAVLSRLDPDLYYPTYGDDSTLVEDAPTSGGLYAKVEKDGNMLFWGNFKSRTEGTELLRNERSLYGAQVVLQSRDHTAGGAPRRRLEGYAAQPDQLPQRDVLRGTGGSVYFLTRQDILVGSETLSVEVRDPDSDRVLSRTTLVQGQDYDINYAQGVVTLFSPLSGYSGGGGLLLRNPNGDEVVHLVAQYEWRPLAGDIDGYAYGGRLTSGLTDQLQLGATVQIDGTGEADQRAYGVDLAWRGSERTFLEAEIARSDGPGFGYTSSLDGGLTGATTTPVGGEGVAVRLKGQAALEELFPGRSGSIGGYYETREAGFSSLDHQVTADEELWGVKAEVDLSARNRLSFALDHYDEAGGERKDEGQLLLRHQWRASVAVELGYGRIDRRDPGRADRSGTRDDLAARLILTPSDRLEWYVFAQGSLEVAGGLDRSDRLGLGGEAKLGRDWTVSGEVSDGTSGVGARLLLGQERGAGNSVYAGYTLDPDRTLDDVTLTGRDRGKFVAGGKTRYSDSVTAFAENTYDLFGQRRSLTSGYGVEYSRSDRTVYTAAIESGRVSDEAEGDLRRNAFSFGVRYDDRDRLSARGRLEYRTDRSTQESNARDVDTILLSGLLRYKFSDEARMVGKLDLLTSSGKSDTVAEGDYADVSLGYALRPILDERLNLLAKYQYVYDMYGQEIDGAATRGPRQRSHVASIDADYDLSTRWTLGGKVGMRFSETAAVEAEEFAKNDALLTVVNARYHLVHNWDVLLEGRSLVAEQAGTADLGAVVGAYRQFGEKVMLGGSYNFGRFSDDLTDMVRDDQGAEINLIAKF
ncbi:TonB-dependent receptor [Cereibacter changlensis]|nr:TonB-dependent receptor [Cereibacter changlensis]PZX56107.1 hypothetical protein LX76_01136 [Cereibacter changlensis]